MGVLQYKDTNKYMPNKKTLNQLKYSQSFMPDVLHHGGDWKQQMNKNSQKAVLKKRKKK